MDLDDIKRGLRAEIKKRENEQYLTFQCNVRQMCKDVLAKLEEQESEIAELKQKLQDQCVSCPVKMQEDDVVADLKAKLENVQASMYADVVDANMENRRLRRALWIARAKRAIEKIAWFKSWNTSISTMNPEDGARQEYDKWKKNLGKLLKKAEEYK